MQQQAQRYNRISNSRQQYSGGSQGYYGNTAYKLNTQPSRRKSVVVPGGASTNPSMQTMSAFGIYAIKAIVAIVAVIAIAFCARVWFSISTVQSMESIESLQASVDEARTAGNELEIEHSTLSNPTRVQSEAKNIGMSYATETERINVVIPASVKTFDNGTISVSDTLSSIESQLASS